jgi:hypothetical protein
MATSDAEQVQITVNLDALIGTLHTALQRVIYLVTTGLQSPMRVDPGSMHLQPVGFQVVLAQHLPWTAEGAAEQYVAWTLANGFRDSSEAMAAFLEDAHAACSFYSLKGHSNAAGRIAASLWNDIVGPSAVKRFHKLSLPDKLRSFSKKFDIRLQPELEVHLLSANAARNCLAHRGGIVGLADVGNAPEQALVVSWRRLRTLFIDAHGVESDLIFGVPTSGPGTIGVRIEDRMKSFAIGTRVTFDAAEFKEIAFSMTLLAADLVQKIAAFGRRLGIPNLAPTPDPGPT